MLKQDANGCPGILVLGMHRSGTSALARVLRAMGAFAGDEADLLPPHPRDNPTGYFERADVMLAHDRYLAATGHAWDRVAGFAASPGDAEPARTLAGDIAHAIAVLRGHGTPWLVKDPRLCLLLPFWLSAPATFACVVAVRDPREIAASLVDTHRGAYTSQFILALWEKYMLALVSALRGRKVLFVSYAALLAEADAQLARLAKAVNTLGGGRLAPTPDAARVVEAAQHRKSALGHAWLTPAQEALYAWLQAQANAAGPVMVADWPAQGDPDPVLAEFEHAADDAARRAREAATHEIAVQLGRVEAQLGHHERERTAWNEELARQRQTNDALRDGLQIEQKGIADLRIALADSQARAGELMNTAQYERHLAAEARAAAEQARLAGERVAHALQQEVDAAHAQLSAQQTELADARAEVAAAQGEAAMARNDTAAARDEAADARADAAAVRAHAERLEADTAALQAHREEIEARLKAMVAHADALSASVDDLKRSWSWRATAPMRAVGGIGKSVPWQSLEHRLARWYYRLPGSAAGKQKFIGWLHAHIPLLTRQTVSYQLQARRLGAVSLPPPSAPAAPAARMDAARAAEALQRLDQPARFSVAICVASAAPKRLIEAAESVVRQFYPHWELAIVANDRLSPSMRQALADLAAQDERIAVRYLAAPATMASLRNEALGRAGGDFFVCLDEHVELTRDALLRMAQAIAADGGDVVYADEDERGVAGTPPEPVYKPDFGIDYLLSANFIGSAFAVRRKTAADLGGFRSDFDAACDYDLLLRASEADARFAHVPEILLRRRSGAGGGDDAALDAVRDSVGRRGLDADVQRGRTPGTIRVRRRVRGEPLVSILLPFRDKPDLLRVSVGSLLEKTRYANFELVGIDNGSALDETHALMQELAARDARVRFIRHDVPFNYSAIVNFGVAQTRGEHLLMLNNDTEVISGDWIESMLEHSQRPEVGVVGALLHYPNDTIQHGGVIVGLGGVAGHAHLMIPAHDPGYCGRAQVIQNLSAVTFACAMTRRDVFEAMGGLDATHLTAAYNDIDYCLRVREAGYLIVYTPFAELYHHESASRTHDLHPSQRARYDAEIRYMQERHRGILQRGDPYYNPHLSLAQGFLPKTDYADLLPV